MCGFVGEIARAPTVCRDRLYPLCNMLIHRGPDESGMAFASDGRWGVAHRRLCVLDIAGGRQPMTHPRRPLTLVYNGEIYDHERLRDELAAKGHCFRTRSDTEVLLALYAEYGPDCFERLRGEFSFVIIDEERREAILARDRMGLKPLFYVRLPNSLLFASEAKALLRAPDVDRAIDPSGLLAAIVVADAPGRTVFRGVEQVPHANYLRVNLDTLKITEHRYWDAFERRRRDLPSDPRELTRLVRDEVDRAITLRLRADVPIGTYLSGGIDSSLVTAVMAQKMDRVEAFSLAFEESPRHNEFHYAEAVARERPNIRLHRIPITHADAIRWLDRTVWHLERPFGNLHSVAKLIQAHHAREHVVCVLTGDGGDESFCGYSTHWLQNELERVNYSLPAIRERLNAMKREAARIGGNRYYLAGGLANRIGPDTAFLEDKLGFRPCDLATAIDAERRIRWLLHPDFRAQIKRSPVEDVVDRLARTIPPADHVPHAVLLQYVQLNSSVPEYIATIADRTEASGSVEARPPLFDHKVVELAMSLPIDQKIHDGREKHVLREAYKDCLPRAVIERRKQAFLAPPSPFQGVDGRALIERHLSNAAVRDAGIWDHRKIALLRLARRLAPRTRILNLVLTIALTAQILHSQFIVGQRSW